MYRRLGGFQGFLSLPVYYHKDSFPLNKYKGQLYKIAY